MMHEIKIYTDGAEFSRGPLSEAQLTIGGTVYRYDHWGITREGGRDCVMLYLRRVGA